MTTYQHLTRLKLWRKDDHGHLVRKFVAKNFAAAMEFMQLVGNVAEELGHHPDMHLTSYRNVEVGKSNLSPHGYKYDVVQQIVLYTHKVNGVTAMDIMGAEKIDAIPVEYSPKWARENIQNL